MAFGNTVNPGVNHEGATVKQVSAGSVKSDWVVVNSSAQTANTDALLNIGTSTDYPTVFPCSVPAGTRAVMFRASVTATGTDTFTTQPVIKPIGVDSAGVPTRIDTPTDADAAGITLTLSAATTSFTANGELWSDPTAEYDMHCDTTIYAFVSTAASILDGAVQQTVTIYARFLN